MLEHLFGRTIVVVLYWLHALRAARPRAYWWRARSGRCPSMRVCLPGACQCACATSLTLLEYFDLGVSKCARCTRCQVSETARAVPCGAQRMGVHDVGVVEGWAHLALPQNLNPSKQDCGAQRMGLRDVGVVQGWARLALPLNLNPSKQDCGAQRMGLRDVGVVEGWARLALPHPDEVAAAEAARLAALRDRTPKRTTPRVEENDRGRDTGALDPLDLSMASPSGKGFPDAELYDEMMPGTMVRAPPNFLIPNPYI